MNQHLTIQILSVFPGKFGGAIFKGAVIGEHSSVICKASPRVLDRFPNKGEFWKVEGTFLQHHQYGLQLIVSQCKLTYIPDPHYVSSVLIKHPSFKGFYLGTEKIRLLVNEFGCKKLVELLDSKNVRNLCSILNFSISQQLINAWTRFKEETETAIFMSDHHFPPELIREVLLLTKEGIVERLKANPYALSSLSGGSKLIWNRIDACAKKLGIASDDDNRLSGIIQFIMYEYLKDGHTVATTQEVIKRSENMLKSRIKAEKGLNLALEKKIICVFQKSPIQMIQLVGPAFIEKELERRFKKLLHAGLPSFLWNDDNRLQYIIDSYTQKCNICFTSEQKLALQFALQKRCVAITGHGGTGKTTTIKSISDICKLLVREVYLLTVSCKAADRLSEIANHKAYTINGFIKAIESKSREISNRNDPLLIIDEASMVNLPLFNRLLSFFEGHEFSLVTVGDPAQIAPIQFGLVWHRMINNNSIPKIQLTRTYRQRNCSLYEISKIVRSNATGKLIELPIWQGEQNGIFLIPANKKELMSKLLEIKIKEKRNHIPPVQIITPHMSNRFHDSADKINRYIQKHLNGESKGLPLNNVWLRIGDPIIVTKNNYNIGLFNGTTGQLIDIEIRRSKIICTFNFINAKIVHLTLDQILDLGLKLSYAISFHKTQRSEYEAVAITLSNDSEMIERSLLYTAITHSKKLCLVVGTVDLFNLAANKPHRGTTLNVGFMREVAPGPPDTSLT